MPFEPLKDTVAITQIGDVPNILVVGPSVKADTVADLVRNKVQGRAATQFRQEDQLIDIVVRLDERKAREVAAAFVGDDWYVSTEAAVEAVRHHGMFDIIHVPSGLNADLIVAVQGAESLDWQYMALWAGRLGVEAEFERVRPRD
jgi:hypothetical protein